jgi:hypothetical protein
MKTTAGYHTILHDHNAEVAIVDSPNVPYDSAAGYYRFVTTLASEAASGATQITVSENLNWQVGDWVMLPQLPSAEAQTSIVLPFLAQVTAVSENTLTLGTALPHAYPAGAWVAKVNRPVTLHFVNNSTSYNVIANTTSSDTAIVSGLRWVWLYTQDTAAGYFLVRANVTDSNPSYTTILPHSAGTNVFYSTVNMVYPTVSHHCGAYMQAIQHTRHIGGVLSATQSVFGSVGNIVIENAHVWDWYPFGNLSNKVSIKNCTIFNFCPRAGVYHIVEDSLVYGLHIFQNFSTPNLNRSIFS